MFTLIVKGKFFIVGPDAAELNSRCLCMYRSYIFPFQFKEISLLFFRKTKYVRLVAAVTA